MTRRSRRSRKRFWRAGCVRPRSLTLTHRAAGPANPAATGGKVRPACRQTDEGHGHDGAEPDLTQSVVSVPGSPDAAFGNRRQSRRRAAVRRGAAAGQGPLRRGRCRHPRPVDRLAPGDDAGEVRQGERLRRRPHRQAGAGGGGHGSRLRLHPQPLHDRPPARDPARERRGLGIRPGQFRLPAGRLRLHRRGQSGGGLLQAPQEPERPGLPVRPVPRFRSEGVPQGPVAGLQDRPLRRRVAREAVRLCRHPHGGLGARPEVPAVGRDARLRPGRHRL